MNVYTMLEFISSYNQLLLVFLGIAGIVVGFRNFWFNYDPEYPMDGDGKRVIGISLFVLGYSLLIYLLVFNEVITKQSNPQFLLYLSSATIQAYAAIIFLPLTILLFRLSGIYPLWPLSKAIIKYVQEMILIYVTILSVSIFCILINPFDNDKYMIYDEWVLSSIIILQVSVTLLPILILRAKFIDVLTLTPVKIMKMIGFQGENSNRDDLGNYHFYDDESRITRQFSQGLSIIKSCIIDATLRDYLDESIRLFVKGCRYINIENLGIRAFFIFKDDIDKFIVEPLRTADSLPDLKSLENFILGVNLMFLTSKEDDAHYTKLDNIFEAYVKNIMEIIKIYIHNDRFEAYDAFLEPKIWSYYDKKGKRKSIKPDIVISNVLDLYISLLESPDFAPGKNDRFKIVISTIAIFKLFAMNPKAFFKFHPYSQLIIPELIREAPINSFKNLIIPIALIENEMMKNKKYKEKYPYIDDQLTLIIDEIKKVIKEYEIQIYLPIGPDLKYTTHCNTSFIEHISMYYRDIDLDMLVINSFVKKYFNYKLE